MSDSDQQLEHGTEMDYLAELTEQMLHDKRQAPLDPPAPRHAKRCRQAEPEPFRAGRLPMLEKPKNTERRKHPRKSCFIPVDYAVGHHAFKDFIKNISLGGVFIDKELPVGHEIVMCFLSPESAIPVKATGQIVRSVPEGIGVEFQTANENLELMIRCFS